jgi:hypothetical protein
MLVVFFLLLIFGKFVGLDLSGDKAEIPSGIQSGHPPTNSDFFFSDLVYDASV